MLCATMALIVALGGVPGQAGPGTTARHGAAAAVSDVNPLTLLDSFTVNGGFAAAASCIGDNSVATGGPDSGTLDLSGVPAGATILGAWIWWSVLDNFTPVLPGAPTFDGVSVTPVALGELPRSPCFPQSFSASFRADVTPLVSGDGTYAVANFPANGGFTGTFTEGVTLAVVYCDGSSPTRTIVIYDGLDVVNSVFVPHTQMLGGFTAGVAPVEAALLFVAGNGQPTSPDDDPLLFNTTDLETIVGTELVLSGSACDFRQTAAGGWWDLGLYDVSPFVNPGDTQAETSVSATNDCYTVSAQILAVTTDDPPQGPTAQPSADSPVCLGSSSTLDGSASGGCSGAIEYRWVDGVGVVCDWSSTPTCDVSPGTTTTYTLEVRCVGSDCALGSAPVTVEVVSPPLGDLVVPALVCAGDAITLDASGTDPGSCPVPLEYQFFAGATLVRPWGPASSHGPLSPAASSSYRVEIRCPGVIDCIDQVTRTVDVIAHPLADGGVDVTLCEGLSLTLDGSASSGPDCPGGLVYTWLQGATVVRPAAVDPTYDPPTTPVGATTYTVIVSCAGLPGCQATDDVVVDVQLCNFAVQFDDYRARRLRLGVQGAIEITWTTLAEDGTLGYVVERAAERGGPWVTIGDAEAHGPGRPYAVRDDAPGAGERPWYRVVEVISAGRGDTTPAFAVSVPSGGRRRGATD